MADKTNEGNLDKPTENQAEILSEENTPTANSVTITQNQETENMEVHHHAHHEGKKNWKSYLWEFLMLFLAVFCGFLAENLREHYVEKLRADQYIHSFYDDLENNLVTCSGIIDGNKKRIEALNDMEACYDNVLKNGKASSCLYGLLKNSRGLGNAQFSDGTLEQLKNAGGYRLLKKEDKDSIIQYDMTIRNYKYSESNVLQESLDNVKNNFKKLINFKANKFLDSANYVPEIPFLFSDNKELLNELFNDLYRYKRAVAFQIGSLTDIKKRTNRLIAYFNAKYHFSN